MLSYRHGFHAGNHADVLKHLVEILLLDYLQKKETGLLYIDTHAGAGCYSLDRGFATQNREYDSGIARLKTARDQRLLPQALQRYLAVVEDCCRKETTAAYPGSPMIALQLLRTQDRAALFELHPSDFSLLQQRFYRQAKLAQSDGFTGLRALLPPPSRRALVLIDPPYEDKTDYATLLRCVQDAVKRFAGGVYALWYPLLPSSESRQLEGQLKSIVPGNYLSATLSIRPLTGERGMAGSGMFVINPPWTLRAELESCLPLLAELLGEQGQGQFTLSGVQR